MIPVRRLSHASLTSPDIARMVAHYTEIEGLRVSHAEADCAVLSTHLGQEALVLLPGPRGCAALALQIAPEYSLAEAAAHLATQGIATERRSDPLPGIDSMLAFRDPNGTMLELFHTARFAPAAEPQGIGVLKLGHVAHTAPEVKRGAEFYTATLGFRVSDWMADFFVFMRCSPEHHTINLLARPQARMHHMAFELKDWAHVQSACELLGRRRIPIIWGPGRHGIGHNIFINYRDPDDHVIELYTEMDRMPDESLGCYEPRPWHRDRPQVPKVWHPDDAALIWGTPATAEFMRES